VDRGLVRTSVRFLNNSPRLQARKRRGRNSAPGGGQ